MSLKIIAIALNVLLLILFGSYFIGHGLPNNPILWTSATLWLVAPLVNLLYIRKNSQTPCSTCQLSEQRSVRIDRGSSIFTQGTQCSCRLGFGWRFWVGSKPPHHEESVNETLNAQQAQGKLGEQNRLGIFRAAFYRRHDCWTGQLIC